MRIIDWSSDVCSSDLPQARQRAGHRPSSRRRQRPSTSGRRVRLTGIDMLSRLPGLPRAVRQETAMSAVSEPRDLAAAPAAPRHDWSRREVEDLFRSEEHTSELQSLMRISYAVFCLKKKKTNNNYISIQQTQL